MTVAELIAKLQKLPPDTPVIIVGDGYPWTPIEVATVIVEKSDYTPAGIKTPCKAVRLS